jgi:WD40 repeat protein
MALSLADRILGTSPDDRLRVVMNAEGIWIEDAESDHRRSLLQKELCIDAAFSPDGKWLALADEQTRIWDVQTRKFHLAIPGSCPVFSPDGKDLLMVDLKFEKTSVYSVADGAVRFVLDGTLPLFGDYFDQGGQRMVTMQKDHWVVHDMERGREISRVQRNIESVAVRLSEDGRRLIGTSIWDASTGKEIASLGKSPVDVAMFTCVAGKRMALAETILSDRILIMDTETGALLYQIEVTKKRGFFNPLAWFSSQDRLMIYPGESVLVYSRRRPEYWWGIAWLPEFWVAYFSGGALLVIAARNLRRRFVRTTDGLASTQ